MATDQRCDFTNTSDADLLAWVGVVAAEAVRCGCRDVVEESAHHMFAAVLEQQAEPEPRVAYGCSLGAGEASMNPGYEAVTAYIADVGQPQVIRTYVGGPDGTDRRWPGVPVIVGPKTIGGASDDSVRSLIDRYAELHAKAGTIYIAPDPEHDRHILKSGWSMSGYVKDVERWRRLIDAAQPHLADHLWCNPTGYQAEQRFPAYVDPVVGLVAGVGVDGYTYAKESTLTQASLDDARWAKGYADSHGRRFAMMEQGVERGPKQADQLRQMLAVVDELRPDCFAYWHTGSPHLDTRLTPEAAAVLRQHVGA